jgi:hypothetical protein
MKIETAAQAREVITKYVLDNNKNHPDKRIDLLFSIIDTDEKLIEKARKIQMKAFW